MSDTSHAGIDPRAAEVLAFWFDVPGGPEHGRTRAQWFRKDAAFDALIAARFGTLIDAAAAGGLGEWEARDPGALALLIVCDQFSRNVFRGDPRAFALDPRALRIARALVAQRRDLGYSGLERWFLYLPFEHAESIADQNESVRLFETLRDDPQAGGALEWALRHREVIERFGRFPHRNEVLGRASTAQEIAFLAQPGSRF